MTEEQKAQVMQYIAEGKYGSAANIIIDSQPDICEVVLETYPNANEDFHEAEEATIMGCNIIEERCSDIFESMDEKAHEEVRSHINDCIHGGLT